MTVEGLAYWGAFSIPIILLVMTGFIRKLVDGTDFRREHWYLGIDLTIYFLASTLVNILDIAKAPLPDERKLVWTAVLVAAAVVFLVIQAVIQQSWQPRSEKRKMQLVMLCGFANLLGILFLYGFVQMKLKGLLF